MHFDALVAPKSWRQSGLCAIRSRAGLDEVLSNLVFGGFAGWRHIWLFEFTTNRNRGVHRHDIECI